MARINYERDTRFWPLRKEEQIESLRNKIENYEEWIERLKREQSFLMAFDNILHSINGYLPEMVIHPDDFEICNEYIKTRVSEYEKEMKDADKKIEEYRAQIENLE